MFHIFVYIFNRLAGQQAIEQKDVVTNRLSLSDFTLENLTFVFLAKWLSTWQLYKIWEKFINLLTFLEAKEGMKKQK